LYRLFRINNYIGLLPKKEAEFYLKQREVTSEFCHLNQNPTQRRKERKGDKKK